MPHTSWPRALLAVRICPADVGRRVTVRHRLPADPRLSDVVGVLTEWTGARLVVRRRDGSLTALAQDQIVAARVVAPEVSTYDVQALAEAGWPAAFTEQLGDWTLRWSHGVSSRANSVRVGGDPGQALPKALAQVRHWYEARGATPLLQVPAPWTHDALLDELGWTPRLRVLLLITPSTDLAARGGLADPTVQITTVPAPDEAWLGMLTDEPIANLPAYREILTGPADVVFLTARDAVSGDLLGVGRASAGRLPSGRSRWAGITSIETAPAARRRGVARAIMAQLGAWACSRSATTTYLQLLATNTPGRELYDSLGFTRHHTYVYRSRQPAAEPVRPAPGSTPNDRCD